MGVSFSSEQGKTTSIMKAKSLFTKGDVERAFAVLKEAASRGNVMACFDAGFMMIQGIGCEKDWKGGMTLLEKGCRLVRGLRDDCWRRDGSLSELFESQSMDLNCLFLC